MVRRLAFSLLLVGSMVLAAGAMTLFSSGWFIMENISAGAYVKLSNGYLFEVSPYDRTKTFIWLPGTSVDIYRTGDALWPAALLNRDDREFVRARLIAW